MNHKRCQCFLVVVLLLAPAFVQCISVLGGRMVRPFSSYRVSVGGGPRPTTLYVAVEGRRASGESFQQGREVQIQPAASRIVDLDIGDLGPGEYSLVARSTSGPGFSSRAALVYQPRSFCVFVQTDQRVYQPGDTISARVVALDKYLLPLSGPVEVSVLDSGGSPVQQWAAALDRGLLSLDLALADEPRLGEWTIQVEVRGQKYSRQVLVAEYVLPRFHLEMKTPKEVLFKDGRFTINVTASHFNGLPVRGELTISAYAVFFSGVLQPVFSSPARKVINFNGQAEVTYDLKTDLDLAEDAARPLVVEAVLEEKNTLIRQNVSSRILLLRTPYRLRVTAPEYFKPTLPYNVQIEVVEPSGKPMSVGGEVSVERLWDDGAPANVSTVPLTQGLALYSIVPDVAHANSTLNLVIRYKDVTERVVNVLKSAPSGGHFLTVELLTKNTSVGDEMRARISATEPMDLLHYAVVGRGDILVAKTLELNPARTSIDVSIGVTAGMAPGCVLLAWYPSLANNSLVSAALYTPQKRTLQNQVSLSVSGGGGSRPGGGVEMQVRGEAGSHAALLALDERAVAAGLAGPHGLGSGLSPHDIDREVESFNGLRHSLFKNEDHLPTMGLDLGGNSTRDVFQNAGVVVLTDAVIPQNAPVAEESSHSLPETGTRPPLAGPYAFSHLPEPPSPRYYLTQVPQKTWTIANLTIGSEGRGVETRRSPVSGAEWLVGAFAVHPTLGLGLAEPQTFTTSIPLRMTAELPATLQRGEVLAAIVTLHSALTVDTSLEVTFHNSEQHFEFEPLENSVDSTKKIELFRRERLTVPARGSASTAFLVSVVKPGEVPIIVEASGNGVSASLFRTIDVKEGYEEELWAWTVLDARRGGARGNVSLTPTAGTRAGPVSLLAAGDLLAPALRASRTPPRPAGDPVHALRPLATACVLLDYLQKTNRDEVAILGEARAMAAAGLQRLMAYRRPDGSFAARAGDGDGDDGDVWMTAVAARWLTTCARHVAVSPAAGREALRWVAHAQLADGSWRSPPIRERVDPHAQAPLPLAAHALLALHQAQGNDVLYKNAVNKALDVLAGGLSPQLDAPTLAVMAAALAVNNHPQAAQALQMMDKHSNATGTTLFWSRTISGNEWRNPWLRDNSLEASTAAWGLRAMVASGLSEQAMPVARFLLQATQPSDPDPDVLEALAQFATSIKSSTKLRVMANATGLEEPRQFSVDDDNALIIQTQLVRGVTSVVSWTEGRGLAVVGVSSQTSTNVSLPWPRYTLDPRVDHTSTSHRLQLSICIGFVPAGNETESGLTLLTVQLPSGYLADINTVTEITSARHVVSARVTSGGARVLAWVRAALGERCATLGAARALPVARQRPGWATLIDLYDSSHRARQFFHPQASTACDVCREWASCSRACGSAESQRAPELDPRDVTTTPGKGGATRTVALTTVLACALALLLR